MWGAYTVDIPPRETAYHTIAFARIGDVADIMSFIYNYWSKEHILAHDQEFFTYFYGDRADVHFVIARDKENGAIDGVLGFVPYGKESYDAVAYALWRTLKTKDIMLAAELLEYCRAHYGKRLQVSCGINTKTLAIHKLMGHHIGTLQHYYRIADKPSYSVANIKNKRILPCRKGAVRLVPIYRIEDIEADFSRIVQTRPCKNLAYIEHRYFMHPVYTYSVYGLQGAKGVIEALLVGRAVEQNGCAIGKIVDYIGPEPPLADASGALQEWMELGQYEYIDCYCYGISEKTMHSAGFVLRDAEDPNIIPNYFEPFEQKNIEILFIASDLHNLRLLRGDGDQDRPNSMLNEREQKNGYKKR